MLPIKEVHELTLFESPASQTHSSTKVDDDNDKKPPAGKSNKAKKDPPLSPSDDNNEKKPPTINSNKAKKKKLTLKDPPLPFIHGLKPPPQDDDHSKKKPTSPAPKSLTLTN
jgi:hypothetical protein